MIGTNLGTMLEELVLVLSAGSIVPILVNTVTEWIRGKRRRTVTVTMGDKKVVVDLESPEEAEFFLKKLLDSNSEPEGPQRD